MSEEPGNILQQLGWVRLASLAMDVRPIQSLAQVVTVSLKQLLPGIPCCCTCCLSQECDKIHAELEETLQSTSVSFLYSWRRFRQRSHAKKILALEPLTCQVPTIVMDCILTISHAAGYATREHLMCTCLTWLCYHAVLFLPHNPSRTK